MEKLAIRDLAGKEVLGHFSVKVLFEEDVRGEEWEGAGYPGSEGLSYAPIFLCCA